MKHPNAVGYAFVVNNEFSSAEAYGSNTLFNKCWPRLLDGAIDEAIADYTDKWQETKVNNDWQKTVLKGDKIVKKSSKKAGVANYEILEYDNFVGNQTTAVGNKGVVHRSWDAKVNLQGAGALGGRSQNAIGWGRNASQTGNLQVIDNVDVQQIIINDDDNLEIQQIQEEAPQAEPRQIRQQRPAQQ